MVKANDQSSNKYTYYVIDYMQRIEKRVWKFLKLAEFTATQLTEQIYSEYTTLDKDLLVTAALLHDIGKLKEYSAVGDFTVLGQMQGHIVLGIEMIQEACIKLNISTDDEDVRKLLHVVLAHHGKLEYGSPIKPLIPEAYVINYADDIDSKMTAISETYNNLMDGEYSQELLSLGGRLMKL